MAVTPVNSLEWWDAYFQHDWEANNGPAQTRHFMEVLVAALPAEVKDWLQSGHRSILDWGCAMGDGVDVLGQAMPGCAVAGLDFAAGALEQARRRYPDYEFIDVRRQEVPKSFDAVVCSNCLEHFETPFRVAAEQLKWCNGVYAILVPYAEDPLLHFHVYSFVEASFPDQIGVFTRFHSRRVRTDPRFWNGEQLLVLYGSPRFLERCRMTNGREGDCSREPGTPREHLPESEAMSIQPKVDTWQEVAKSYATQPQDFDIGLANEILAILRSAGINPPKSLLEAGCGSGHLSLLLRKAGYETGLLDFSQLALDKAAEAFQAALGPEASCKTICGDLMRLSEAVAPKSYDVVWNSGVLEHFSCDVLQKALQEMAAVARQAVLFVVPNPASFLYLCFRVKAQSSALWEYGAELLRHNYREIAESSGLTIAAHGYCGKAFTLDQLRLLVGNPEDRAIFEQVVNGAQCPEQALYLEYFLCTPDRLPPGATARVQEDAPVLDRTFYLDTLAAANLSVACMRKQAETADLRASAAAQQTGVAEVARAETERKLNAKQQEIEAAAGELARTRAERDALNVSLQQRDRDLSVQKAALEARVAELETFREALKAQLSAREECVRQLHQYAVQADTSAKQLAWQIGPVRDSRRYKLGHIISAFKQAPLRSLTRSAKWAVGGYKSSGAGLFAALESPDPLKPIQDGIMGQPLPPVLEPMDPLLARAQEAPGVVLFVSSVDWKIFLAQRNHHFAREFARRGYISIYDVSDFVNYDFTGFKEIEPNLFLFRGTAAELNRFPNLTLWTFCYNYNWRDRYPAAEHVIYDLIDDFAVHPFDPEFLRQNHERALREATLVAYVARHLERWLKERPDSLYLPNGVDDEHFGAPSLPLPENDPDFAAITSRGKPIAGYYGALAEWFDYDLLAEVARRRRDWEFVLIGPDYDKSIEKQPVLKADNVHWIGARDYSVLPRYLRAFDVATIPFKINEITLATSPLKLYEFFAGQKPVVTTAMPECVGYPEVNIARDAAEFSAALDKARAQGQDPAFREHLREIGRQNSWAERVREVEKAMALASQGVTA
jgi:SAM-dependent methyltransferase